MNKEQRLERMITNIKVLSIWNIRLFITLMVLIGINMYLIVEKILC